MISLAWVLASVFVALALLHAYWAVGGTWASGVSIPKHPDGRAVFSPGPIACLVVALGLAGFACLCLAHLRLVASFGIHPHTRIILWGISGLFLLRGIGDFKYAGIFRKIRDTDFARYDRLLFTPLCLSLAGLLACLAFGVAKT